MDGRLRESRPSETHQGGAFEISRLLPGDVEACARIVAGTELWHRYSIDFDRALKLFKKALENHEPVFVARSGDEVVGFVWAIPRGMFGRSGYIKLIGVAPSARGKGIGAKLLHHAEQFLARFDRDVFLLVSDFNTSAQKFYRREGYVEIGRLPNYAVEGITEVLMWKRLE